MPTEKPSTSPAELDVLKVLWDIGPCTARHVFEVVRSRGSQWTYATVLTLLRRLEAKGYATRDKKAFAHTFRAVVSRDRLLWTRLSDLARELCDGTVTPLVLALVRGGRPSADEVNQVRQLLDDLDARRAGQHQKRGGKRRKRSR